jgi:SAM-dependent methyltransferase
VTTATARFFDVMAESYAALEPWYAHLYAVLHGILDTELAGTDPPRGRALDAGCGTGFQTALLIRLGYRVHGVDISTGALRVARQRHGAEAALAAADVTAMPYVDERFDVAVCCGSTLNFVEDPARALAEIARVLRPGGRLLLECEHRWSLDVAWALLSGLCGDALGYGLTARQAWALAATARHQGVWIDYPGYPPLRLATRAEVQDWLAVAGLVSVRTWGIHAVTNLIPSTALHRPCLRPALSAIYRVLARVDRVAGRSAVGRRLANSLVVLARKP